MKINVINSKPVQPAFKAKLISEHKARKLIYKTLTPCLECAFSKMDFAIKAPQGYKMLQKEFKNVTKGIGGTFKMILSDNERAINIIYKRKGKGSQTSILDKDLEAAKLNPCPNENGEPSFSEPVKKIIAQLIEFIPEEGITKITARRLKKVLDNY